MRCETARDRIQESWAAGVDSVNSQTGTNGVKSYEDEVALNFG